MIVEGEVGHIKFSTRLPETKFYFFGGDVLANAVSHDAEKAFNII